jgi:hypothetical protein
MPSCRLAPVQVLSGGHLAKLSDAGLAPVITNGSLQSLSLHSSATVTDATLASLASYCKETLTALDISFCRSVTLSHCHSHNTVRVKSRSAWDDSYEESRTAVSWSAHEHSTHNTFMYECRQFWPW